MVKKTFSMLGKHPEILGVCLLSTLLLAFAAIPAFLRISAFMSNIISEMDIPDSLADEQMVDFIMGYISSLGLIMLMGLVVGFLLLPPIFNRVYELSEGIEEPGWIERGMKRSWWKVVVTTLAAGAATIALNVVSSILGAIPVIGWLASIAAVMALGIFKLIAYAATIAEDDYATGIKRTFVVGWKYFFKMLGAAAVAFIPVILFSLGVAAYMTFNLISMSNSETADVLLKSFMTGMLTRGIWITYGAVGLLSVLANCFLYVYGMQLYVENRKVMFPAADEAAQE